MKSWCSFKVVFAILFCGQLLAIDVSEPQCYSRFDYDEKMLKKMLRIEDEFEKFSTYVDELKLKEDRLEKQADDLKRKEAALDLQRQQEHDQFITAMNDSLTELESKMANFKASMHDSAAPVAFTVKKPDGENDKNLTFATIITNKGDGYDINTGKFTCKVPGMYYFSVHVIKVLSKNVKHAYCYICKNGAKSTLAYTGPQLNRGSDNAGLYAGSNAVNLKLDKGDVVNLCLCSDPSSFDHNSSFSGHLFNKL